jgi:hypothetical protein
MAERRTFIIELGKYNLIRDVITNSMEGILLNAPQRQRGMETYYLGRTGCGLFYDGENVITIGGNRTDSVIKTKSELEEKSGVELKES